MRLLLALLLLGCADSIDDDDSGSSGDDDDVDGLCDTPGASDAVPWDPSCRVEIVLPEEPALEIVWQLSAFAPEPAHDQVMMTPIVVPLTDDDGDGFTGPGDWSAVVFSTFAGIDFNGDGILRAARGDGSGLLWSNDVREWRVQPDAGIAAGDIDGDGWPEIVAVGEDQHLLAFEHDGTGKWRSVAQGMADRGAPALADLNGDGQVEIVYGSQIFDSGGVLRAQGEHGTGANPARQEFPVPVVVDLDGNGLQEVVVGNAIYDAAGGALWFNGGPDGFVGVGNFDADGEGEIVVVSENTLRILDTNGLAIRGPVDLIADGSGGPPTVADFDGDGAPEIGVANRSFYAVYDTDLSVLWSNETRDYSSSITGSSAFDFDGDGASEVVYADEQDVWVWDGRTGDVVHQGSGHSSATQIEYPIVARLEPNGPPAIVVASNTLITEGWNGITVLADAGRSWAPTRGVWSQHAFLPTQIDDYGGIPPQPAMPWSVGQGLRQNEVVTAPGVPTPNLAVEPHAVCFDACPEFVRVRLQAVNMGHAAGPFAIGVLDSDGVQIVASAQLPQGLGEGARSAPLDLLVPAAVAAEGMWARADFDDAVLECEEGDNAVVIAPATCPD